MNLKRIPYLLALFILLALPAKSEVTAPECPPEDMSCPWEPFSFEMPLTDRGGATALITGRKRICNGNIEIIYDDIQAKKNSMYFEEENFYEKNFSALRELIDINIIENVDGLFHVKLPFCPETISIIKIYAASCGVWVKCSYEVSPASEMCDIGYEPPTPMYNNNGKNYVDVYKWQSCGVVCCRKEYRVCQEYDPQHGDVIINIVNVTKNPISRCTQEGQYIDWKTGKIIPCKPGC